MNPFLSLTLLLLVSYIVTAIIFNLSRRFTDFLDEIAYRWFVSDIFIAINPNKSSWKEKQNDLLKNIDEFFLAKEQPNEHSR